MSETGGASSPSRSGQLDERTNPAQRRRVCRGGATSAAARSPREHLGHRRGRVVGPRLVARRRVGHAVIGLDREVELTDARRVARSLAATRRMPSCHPGGI
jgi:hypothetical protein